MADDTKAVHDSFTNKISFQHHDQKIILKPLSPREVCDDQIKMREKRKKRVRNHRGIGKRRVIHERKFNCFAEASEVRKVLLAHEPLNLQYCKDSKISTDNSFLFLLVFNPYCRN